MPMNRVQFQPGVSMPEFFERYGTEEKCVAELTALRWPQGFRCPRCDSPAHYVVGHGSRRLFQCRGCRHQTSLTAGTVLDSTKLPLRTWFLAMFLISQDKTGLSSLALMRHLGNSYRAAWLVHHKLMAAMAEHDANEPLSGSVQWARQHDGLLVLTWDEDDVRHDNRILTLFVGPMVQPGPYARRVSHYDLLRTIEALYKLPFAGEAANARTIDDIWRR